MSFKILKTPAILALAGTLLLGACSQQPTAPVAAAPTPSVPVTGNPAPRAAALGLYELHISSVNGKLTSSVTRVGGGKLSAQEISGLTFTPAAATVMTAGSDKHISVAVTVNNTTGTTIARPTFVPVAISGYTQNGTFFRAAQDSAGATTDPTGITIEQAVSGTTTVQRDPNATPLVSTIDTSTLTFDVPAGTSVASVSTAGWQSPALAAGGTQTVTFGLNAGSNATYRMNLVFGVFDGPALSSTSATGTAILSEYVEGSSNNKALEIYNASQATIPSGTLTIRAYTCGNSCASSTPSASLPIAKDLLPGETYVVANIQASDTLKARANLTMGTQVITFNGDDSLTLVSGSTATVLDSFGLIGTDPGNAWTGNGVSTVDQTLSRKGGIVTGDTNTTDAFDPSAQWNTFAQDTFTGLGTR